MLRLLILIAYCTLLLLLAFLPPVPIPGQPAGIDLKLHHVAAFTVLTVLTWIYLQAKMTSRSLTSSIIFAFAFGVFIELVQLTIAYRSGRWQDLISNAVGILLGVLVIFGLRSKKNAKS